MIGKELTPVLQEIEKAGYEYCILGGETLPIKITGSDIDVLINKIDDKIKGIFEKHGFVKSKGIQVFKGKPVVFCKYVPEIGWVPVHAIESVLYGSIQIAPINFQEDTDERCGLKFATDELYVCVTMAQCIIKGEITDKRLQRLKEKSSRKQFDKCRCEKLIGYVNPVMQSACKEILQNNSSIVARIVKKEKLIRKATLKKRVAGYFSSKIGVVSKSKRGLIVGLEGIDGSGKSTLINKLNESIPRKGRTLFFVSSMAGRGFGKWSRKFRSIWRKSCDRKGVKNSVLKNGMLPFVILVEIANTHYLYYKALYKKLCGYNVIFDRYACLHYVRQVVHNKSVFYAKGLYIKLLYYFLVKKFPPPDVLVFLDIDPEEARKRKMEDELSELRKKKEVYSSAIVSQVNNSTEVVIISSMQESCKMADEFLSRFWKRLV